MFNLQEMVTRILALLIAVIGHELGHGWVAYLLGDHTAKDDGRLSLNPIHHIDPVGLLCLIVFRIGWAKPVPINPMYFKNRKRDTIFVSLAGVCVNFLLALITAPLLVLFWSKGNFLTDFLSQLLWYNVMLAVFNLVPLPPLDGSKVLASLLPEKLEYQFYRHEKKFYIFLMLAVLTGLVDKVISPVIISLLNGFLTFGEKLVL